ncbi:Polyamine-modulated factor 1 [Camponotus japonicus]
MAEAEEVDRPNNARLFQVAVTNSLRNISESVSENEFVDILPILKSKPSIAQKLHKALIKELYNGMSNDVENILKEGSLQDVLSKIAKLSEENTTSVNEDAWRPPGDVITHLRSLDAHKIKEATEELEKQVNEIEEENETLMKTITENRSRICATNDSMMRIFDRMPIILQELEKMYEELTNCHKMIKDEHF